MTTTKILPHDFRTETMATAAPAIVDVSEPRIDMDGLAHHIAEAGIGYYEPEVADVVAIARRSVSAADMAALDVLADRCAPAVARERAFGHVARLIA